MANHELHSFMTKLLNPRRAGKNARLTIECLDGKTYVNLQLHLESPPEPVYYHEPRPRPTPSRLRRRARRENARNTAAANASVRDTAVQADPPAPQVDAAVQAVVPALLTVDAAVQAVHPEVQLPLLHEQLQPARGVTEQAEHHQANVNDMLCPDAEYLPALSQLHRDRTPASILQRHIDDILARISSGT